MRRRNLTAVRAHPNSVSLSLLVGLAETHPKDIVLFGFPDTIWDPQDGFVRLIDVLEGFEVALGLFRGREPQRSDVVEIAESGLVVSVQVKPSMPKSDWVWGMAVARRRGLDALATYAEPGAAFDSMCRREQVIGVQLLGPFVDIGTPEALHALARELHT